MQANFYGLQNKYKILAFHVKFCKMKSMKILHDQFAIQVIYTVKPLVQSPLNDNNFVKFMRGDWTKGINFSYNFYYNSLKYGDCFVTRIQLAPGRIHHLWSDLEQVGSELETSLHIWDCYKKWVKIFMLWWWLNVILIWFDKLEFNY